MGPRARQKKCRHFTFLNLDPCQPVVAVDEKKQILVLFQMQALVARTLLRQQNALITKVTQHTVRYKSNRAPPLTGTGGSGREGKGRNNQNNKSQAGNPDDKLATNPPNGNVPLHA